MPGFLSTDAKRKMPSSALLQGTLEIRPSQTAWGDGRRREREGMGGCRLLLTREEVMRLGRAGAHSPQCPCACTLRTGRLSHTGASSGEPSAIQLPLLPGETSVESTQRLKQHVILSGVFTSYSAAYLHIPLST